MDVGLQRKALSRPHPLQATIKLLSAREVEYTLFVTCAPQKGHIRSPMLNNWEQAPACLECTANSSPQTHLVPAGVTRHAYGAGTVYLCSSCVSVDIARLSWISDPELSGTSVTSVAMVDRRGENRAVSTAPPTAVTTVATTAATWDVVIVWDLVNSAEEVACEQSATST